MQAPAFNYPNESRRRFCADHKLDGMINLRKKRPRSELDLAGAVASQPQVTNHHLVSLWERPDRGLHGKDRAMRKSMCYFDIRNSQS